MKNLKIMAVAILFLAFGAVSASAATISLFDLAFNIDGTVSAGSIPLGINSSGFDLSTGLGKLTWTTSVAGEHSIIAFFDHDIDEKLNGYFNEFGEASGDLAFGQSSEIDEPGYYLPFGDIYDNVTLSGVLDGFNAVPSGLNNDVSMAMGWDFLLANDETALITFILSSIKPKSGFYLTQTDPDSVASLYFSSSLSITGGTLPPDDDDQNPIPEPGTFILLGAGLVGLMGLRLRKRHLK